MNKYKLIISVIPSVGMEQLGFHWRDFQEILRKATVSLIISVIPSVGMEQLGFHWRDFQEILYLNIFSKNLPKKN
jgi:hypothetical protein